MKTTKNRFLILFIIPLLALVTGCGAGGSDSVASEALLDGTVTSEGIYFSPLRAPEDEAVLADESVNLEVDGEPVTVRTDSRGRFQLRMRQGSGDCNASGGGQHRYGGNGRFGSGEKIRWNFVDNDNDGICDNTLEVVLQ